MSSYHYSFLKDRLDESLEALLRHVTLSMCLELPFGSCNLLNREKGRTGRKGEEGGLGYWGMMALSLCEKGRKEGRKNGRKEEEKKMFFARFELS